MNTKERITIAIDGNSGAGKTTLAEMMGTLYDCNIFSMDSFFLPPEMKTEERLNEVGGNVDYLRFKEEVIKGIQSGLEFQYRAYDCKTMTFKEPLTVRPKQVNIIEGSYSMHPRLINNYDIKVFLHIDKEEQSQRILLRNGATMHERFINEWIPLENRYFKELAIKEQCDFVFHGSL